MVGALTAAGCATTRADRPVRIVVTTNILGDVVSALAPETVDVEVLMPVGADPHEFSLSARQGAGLETADLLVTNGAGIEGRIDATLRRVIARGLPHVEVAQLVTLRGDDPHLWGDPSIVAASIGPLAAAIAELPGVDPAEVDARARAYSAQLDALDAEVREALSAIAPADRILVTSHDVLSYFAARYDLELLGAAISSPTTDAQPSARGIERLAALARDRGVPAVFADASASTKVVTALARAIGAGVAVVPLYTESLGEPGSGADTYVGMMRTNAERIAEALAR